MDTRHTGNAPYGPKLTHFPSAIKALRNRSILLKRPPKRHFSQRTPPPQLQAKKNPPAQKDPADPIHGNGSATHLGRNTEPSSGLLPQAIAADVLQSSNLNKFKLLLSFRVMPSLPYELIIGRKAVIKHRLWELLIHTDHVVPTYAEYAVEATPISSPIELTPVHNDHSSYMNMTSVSGNSTDTIRRPALPLCAPCMPIPPRTGNQGALTTACSCSTRCVGTHYESVQRVIRRVRFKFPLKHH